MTTYDHSWQRIGEGKPWGESTASVPPKYRWECSKCGKVASWPCDDGQPPKGGCPVPDADAEAFSYGDVPDRVAAIVAKAGDGSISDDLYSLVLSVYDLGRGDASAAEGLMTDAPLDMDGTPIRIGDWLRSDFLANATGEPLRSSGDDDMRGVFECIGYARLSADRFPDENGWYFGVLARCNGDDPFDHVNALWIPALTCSHVDHVDARSLLGQYGDRLVELDDRRDSGTLSDFEFDVRSGELLEEYVEKFEEWHRPPDGGVPPWEHEDVK